MKLDLAIPYTVRPGDRAMFATDLLVSDHLIRNAVTAKFPHPTEGKPGGMDKMPDKRSWGRVLKALTLAILKQEAKEESASTIEIDQADVDWVIQCLEEWHFENALAPWVMDLDEYLRQARLAPASAPVPVAEKQILPKKAATTTQK